LGNKLCEDGLISTDSSTPDDGDYTPKYHIHHTNSIFAMVFNHQDNHYIVTLFNKKSETSVMGYRAEVLKIK